MTRPTAMHQIFDMLVDTYGDAGRVTAMQIWKGYDVSTGKTGWHMRDFGRSNVHYMGASIAEVTEWCADVASSFEQVN